MDCCYPEDCGEYSVAPMLVTPCYATTKCCEEPPMCYPCLPRCPRGVVYCCERKPPRCPRPGPVCCEPSESCDSHHHNHHHCGHSPVRCPETRSRARCCISRSPPRYCETHSPSPTRQSSCPTNCAPCPPPLCKPVKTKYVMPCYRYEDGRIVRQLPVTAFKRNGMQDQEHSKMLGTVNFLTRCPRDVMVECDICTHPVRVADPAKVPPCSATPAMNQPTLLMRRACEVAIGARAPRKKPFVESSFRADHSGEVRRYHSEDERGNCCFHFERKKKCLVAQCQPQVPPYHHQGAGSCAHCAPRALVPAPVYPPCLPCAPYAACTANPECQYVDCVHAKVADPPDTCCFYRV